MKLQEIYDRVAEHLLTQQKRSIGELGACVYRSPEGLKCAVGCLISDEAYSPKIEGTYVREQSVQEALRESGVKPLTEQVVFLLEGLQACHDDFYPEDWGGRLWSVANRFELKPHPRALKEEGVTK